jgi:CheY-like chemotaxis protein
MPTKNTITKLKILLVDDNDQVRTTLTAVLEANQFRLSAAPSVGRRCN